MEESSPSLAEEVCWGLTLGVHFGMKPKEILDFIWKDFERWADEQEWPDRDS